jgi:RimJ/RimL family protein N-acetyltransferase
MTTAVPGPAYRILTPRLVIRCWDPADAPLVSEAVTASVEHLRPWLDWVEAEPKSLQDRIATLRYFRGHFDQDKDLNYGIFGRDEQRVLGSVALHTGMGQGTFEIGYWIHATHTNQGLATEAAGALTKAAFELHGARRLGITCDVRNVCSAAVPRKLGYIHEAPLHRRGWDSEGTPRDVMVWSLFDDGYPASPAAQAQIEAYDAIGRRIL